MSEDVSPRYNRDNVVVGLHDARVNAEDDRAISAVRKTLRRPCSLGIVRLKGVQ